MRAVLGHPVSSALFVIVWLSWALWWSSLIPSAWCCQLCFVLHLHLHVHVLLHVFCISIFEIISFLYFIIFMSTLWKLCKYLVVHPATCHCCKTSFFWPIGAAVHSSGQTLKTRRRTDFSFLVDLVFSIHAVLFSPGQHSVLYTTECVKHFIVVLELRPGPTLLTYITSQ